MELKNKIRIGWFAFAFVVGHFAMIFLFAFPQQYIPNTLRTASYVYVYPVFEQSWSLFAPCPIIDAHMKVKYYFGSDSTDWINPVEDAENLHSKLRFTHHGDLVVGESNLLFWIGGDLDFMGISRYEPFPADSLESYKKCASYWQTYYYLSGNADYLFDQKPTSALVECSFENVVTGESGVMLLPEFNWKR